MFRTQALASLKGIFPPIHQPLPLTPRDSQRLLDALTTSFRKQLDKEYGFAPDATADGGSQSHHRPPTDRHLRAILNNPLFSHSHIPDKAAALPQVDTGRDPKLVFRQAVAKGLMTKPRALGFLLTVMEQVRHSAAPSLRAGLKNSGAGLLVVQWLRASGQERELSFFESGHFIWVLLQFMVAEDLEPLVWTWLERLAKGDMPAESKKQAALNAETMLRRLVSVKCLYCELEDAIATILRGEALLKASNVPVFALYLNWRNLAWQATAVSWKYPPPAAKSFDSLVDMQERVATSRRRAHASTELLSQKAHLELHHPDSPDPTRAVEVLTSEKTWLFDVPSAASRNYHINLLQSMGLDAVRHLTKAGETKVAQDILERIYTHLVPNFSDRIMPAR
ncbi:hypothetical protein B0T26DRAFT_641520 [Lasiosphaeria miniovina]|uniref:Uncharacterized protein n=1 Tax=Lasiosphaeria miniovina TaxID=1954250 RepID=A0AA40AU08_9PEZI|nr:uncharacterized protein B0T26DRAFT_641520 [Lasiosphaeria miniovina]KAK0722005.1 hypothetical protein B0T26DRAFT_641520 [Lasiosphaeria miniovina]